MKNILKDFKQAVIEVLASVFLVVTLLVSGLNVVNIAFGTTLSFTNLLVNFAASLLFISFLVSAIGGKVNK